MVFRQNAHISDSASDQPTHEKGGKGIDGLLLLLAGNLDPAAGAGVVGPPVGVAVVHRLVLGTLVRLDLPCTCRAKEWSLETRKQQPLWNSQVYQKAVNSMVDDKYKVRVKKKQKNQMYHRLSTTHTLGATQHG